MSDRWDVEDDFMSDVDGVYGDIVNDGWDDLELEFEEFLTLYNFLYFDGNGRKSFWDHDRLDWSKHLEKLWHEGLFARRYRLPEKAFDGLVELLLPMLSVDVTKSRNRCSHEIYPEIIVAIDLAPTRKSERCLVFICLTIRLHRRNVFGLFYNL